jgi:hypothetical protein
MFPVSRLRPLLIDIKTWYLATALVGIAAWGFCRLTRNLPESKKQRAGLFVCLAVCAGSLAAMPVTSIAIGKLIQIYHYHDSFTRYFSLAFLVLLAVILSVLLRRWNWIVVPPAALLCLFPIWYFATGLPMRSNHLRSEFQEWGQLDDYRSSFVEVVKELSKPQYSHRVLGTFDHQLWSWWTTFNGGYSYLADACTTNVDDSEIERRAATLARAAGMTGDDFSKFILRRYVMIFWMSCDRFQSTLAYSYAPPDDYTEQDLHQMRKTRGDRSFEVALPLSQRARLRKLFDSEPRQDRLDLIALTKDESLQQYQPSALEFELAFENRLFRVWKRKNS